MIRPRPWLALLVSALAHLAVALVLLAHGGRNVSADRSAEQPGRELVVRLIGPQRAAVPAPALVENQAAIASAPAAVPAVPAAPAARGGNAVPEPHYFEVGALTQAPVLRSGMAAGGRMLIVPGITPTTVTLQVWISDEGTVDRVTLDAPLPEGEQELLVAAFAKVRFSPGRVGHIAVRSQKKMEVFLDFALHS